MGELSTVDKQGVSELKRNSLYKHFFFFLSPVNKLSRNKTI